MKGLLYRQLQQFPTSGLALVDVVNPEFPAFASMFGDRATILTRNGDFHVIVSLRVFAEHPVIYVLFKEPRQFPEDG